MSKRRKKRGNAQRNDNKRQMSAAEKKKARQRQRKLAKEVELYPLKRPGIPWDIYDDLRGEFGTRRVNGWIDKGKNQRVKNLTAWALGCAKRQRNRQDAPFKIGVAKWGGSGRIRVHRGSNRF